MSRPIAIGYLRRDVSGISQPWHETQIRSLAKRLGYELAKTVVFGRDTEAPVDRLLEVVRSAGAEAIVVPGSEHFGGKVPERLVRVCDVITVSPQYTYARSYASPFLGDGA
ncbi:hypothetical protein NONI108955_17530 [Nocardia ninae]|uniref:Resolvase/invertase-type recombinase catalytic domain-containing protein n=1 Tax=Nocardia ninae NBRC 108245 TaxID=1210091 RepID=A0A511MR76_9NOCA|nr:hypothetical protein [Nocardia ninae]GEM43060.1 hypothetical protein NN4_75790 [Nocardia ninae NBRC 108245]